MTHAEGLISCLCVTRTRVKLLKRAVDCFLKQTHPDRELVILFDSDDAETRQYLATLSDPRIRGVESPAPPQLSLGLRRNRAVAEARGYYICTWDDDDWYHPDRLAIQLSALRQSGRPACMLSRLICLDTETLRAYIAPYGAWEGSVLVERNRMVAYPDLARGEDTVVIDALRQRDHVHLLDRPDLYVYTIHGSNTWHRGHFAQILKNSTPVTPSQSQQIVEETGSKALANPALSMREHLAPTRYWFDQAARRGREPMQTSYFRFAGEPVRMQVVGNALSDHLTQTFAQLAADDVNPDGPFALTINAWDRATTGLGCPGVPMPPDQTQLLDAGLITTYGGGRIVRYERGHYVNAIDRLSSEIFTWRADGNDQALYERAKPFPNMLEMWYRDQAVQQLHAGLVAHNGKGVLFIGKSGAGKSTCTIACALDGFDYLGDDHNGLQMTPDGHCIGHSFYNAARIGPGHLAHFPELRAHQVRPHSEYDEKSLVWMTQVRPGNVARSCQIVAVVMPRIASGPTRSCRASKVQTLIALAPSTLKLPQGGGFGGFMNLADFIPKMPCFLLECGPDISQIAPSVRKIIQQATGGAD